MKPAPFLLLALATAAMAVGDPPEDLLRFSNDDQLHGRFEGFEDKTITWQRKDVPKPIAIDSSSVRQIVLHGGRPARGIDTTSYARLTGGDRIPGAIVSLDDKTLTIDTPYAGQLSIPRNHVDVLAPTPFGGLVRYAGPFTPDGWRIVEKPKEPENDAKENADAKNKDPKEAPAKAEDKEPADKPDEKQPAKSEEPAYPPAWTFARTAWYSAPSSKALRARMQLQNQMARGANPGADGDTSTPAPLVLDNILGDAASLRFHLAWRNQIGLYVAFQADFAGPPESEEDDAPKAKAFSYASRSLPYHFGNSYALALTNNYGMLYGCGFDEKDGPFTRRMQSSSSSIRIGQSGEVDIELRFDRRNGRILLFIDREFTMQWDEDPDDWVAKGSGIGFLVTNPDCQVRISDILVTDWSGKIDSARSMEDQDRDVVLLTNGTDRFSGKIESIQENLVSIKGSYATMRVPLDQVAEIHFARKSLADAPEPAPERIVLHLHPLGRLSGKPVKASADSISISSPDFGDAEVQLDFVNLLDFQSSTSFLDEWDINF